MKRNETVLVYAVTGLLLVILLVAVVFGDPSPVDAEETRRAVAEADSGLPGLSPAGDGLDPKAADRPGAESQPKSATPGVAGNTGEGALVTAGTTPETGAAKNGIVTTALDSQPGERLPLSATPPTPEQALESVLGASRRVGDYRVVQCRRGDSLRRLAERWCGDASKLSVVEALNETLVGQTLSYGQEVMVPVVEADVLLTRHQERKALQAKAERVKGELYTLKRGDSLWNLAKVRVAANMIPAWLARFRQLNPEITDPSVLVAGQKVRLPGGAQRKP